MKRILWLVVALMLSGLPLYAQAKGKAKPMTGWLCNSKCVTQSASAASCDQSCSETSGDLVLVDDHGQVLKIANQDKVKSFVGKKVKMMCRKASDTDDSMYVDTVSLYGGGG